MRRNTDSRKSGVVALVCSDLHLSERPPTARSNEPDWFAAQRRALSELRELQRKMPKGVPILYAGDIFHTPTESPATINFAIVNLPHGYAIPGQHDLLHHQYANIKRTAYWTLVEAGILTNLEPYERVKLKTGIHVTGFPWGTKLTPYNGIPSLQGHYTEIALVHKYVWSDRRTCYPGAPEDASVTAMLKQEPLRGFDFAVFGDNHQTWCSTNEQSTTYINCGCFIKRRSDERHYSSPRVHILYHDGTYGTHELDTSKDVWCDLVEAQQEITDTFELGSLMDEFQKLAAHGTDFLEQVKRVAQRSDVGQRTRELLSDILKEFQK